MADTSLSQNVEKSGENAEVSSEELEVSPIKDESFTEENADDAPKRTTRNPTKTAEAVERTSLIHPQQTQDAKNFKEVSAKLAILQFRVESLGEELFKKHCPTREEGILYKLKKEYTYQRSQIKSLKQKVKRLPPATLSHLFDTTGTKASALGNMAPEYDVCTWLRRAWSHALILTMPLLPAYDPKNEDAFNPNEDLQDLIANITACDDYSIESLMAIPAPDLLGTKNQGGSINACIVMAAVTSWVWDRGALPTDVFDSFEALRELVKPEVLESDAENFEHLFNGLRKYAVLKELKQSNRSKRVILQRTKEFTQRLRVAMKPTIFMNSQEVQDKMFVEVEKLFEQALWIYAANRAEQWPCFPLWPKNSNADDRQFIAPVRDEDGNVNIKERSIIYVRLPAIVQHFPSGTSIELGADATFSAVVCNLDSGGHSSANTEQPKPHDGIVGISAVDQTQAGRNSAKPQQADADSYKRKRDDGPNEEDRPSPKRSKTTERVKGEDFAAKAHISKGDPGLRLVENPNPKRKRDDPTGENEHSAKRRNISSSRSVSVIETQAPTKRARSRQPKRKSSTKPLKFASAATNAVLAESSNAQITAIDTHPKRTTNSGQTPSTMPQMTDGGTKKTKKPAITVPSHCSNCRDSNPTKMIEDRCDECYAYLQLYRKERPSHLWNRQRGNVMATNQEASEKRAKILVPTSADTKGVDRGTDEDQQAQQEHEDATNDDDVKKTTKNPISIGPICSNCSVVGANKYSLGRCGACYAYWHKYKRERPKELYIKTNGGAQPTTNKKSTRRQVQTTRAGPAVAQTTAALTSSIPEANAGCDSVDGLQRSDEGGSNSNLRPMTTSRLTRYGQKGLKDAYKKKEEDNDGNFATEISKHAKSTRAKSKRQVNPKKANFDPDTSFCV